MAAASEDFAEVCRRAADVLEGLDGYLLERVVVDSSRDGGVDVFLRIGPDGPDVMVSLSGIVHVAIGSVLDMDAAFVDGIGIRHIPGDEPTWPGGLSGLGARVPGSADVAWLSIEGPTPVDVVARTVTVFVAQAY